MTRLGRRGGPALRRPTTRSCARTGSTPASIADRISTTLRTRNGRCSTPDLERLEAAIQRLGGDLHQEVIALKARILGSSSVRCPETAPTPPVKPQAGARREAGGPAEDPRPPARGRASAGARAAGGRTAQRAQKSTAIKPPPRRAAAGRAPREEAQAGEGVGREEARSLALVTRDRSAIADEA